MAAISHVFTIRRAAQILGRDEDLLWELSDQLEPEDGKLWVCDIDGAETPRLHPRWHRGSSRNYQGSDRSRRLISRRVYRGAQRMLTFNLPRGRILSRCGAAEASPLCPCPSAKVCAHVLLSSPCRYAAAILASPDSMAAMRPRSLPGPQSSPAAHRGARVIGADALRIVLISPEPSDGQECNQDNEDNPNINAHQSSPAAGSVPPCYWRRPMLPISAGKSSWHCSSMPSLTLLRLRRQATRQSPLWQTRLHRPSNIWPKTSEACWIRCPRCSGRPSA